MENKGNLIASKLKFLVSMKSCVKHHLFKG